MGVCEGKIDQRCPAEHRRADALVAYARDRGHRSPRGPGSSSCRTTRARGASRCEESRLVVGTSATADLVVRDATVSSRHCALSVLGDGVAIEDLGSRNGTFVGSARVREAWGRAGTAVAIGHSTLVVLVAEAREAVGSSPASRSPGVAGGSIAMRRLADQVRRLSRHALPVLVAGESGTGKELIARALHHEGPRRDVRSSRST